MACCTRCRVAAPTGRYPLTTLDTVATDTPARLAMSLRLTTISGTRPDPLGAAEVGLRHHDDDQERAADHRLVRGVQRADLVDDVLDDAQQQHAAQRADRKSVV